jgi:hypothetical protein
MLLLSVPEANLQLPVSFLVKLHGLLNNVPDHVSSALRMHGCDSLVCQVMIKSAISVVLM